MGERDPRGVFDYFFQFFRCINWKRVGSLSHD
jgi:hypothetical protein